MSFSYSASIPGRTFTRLMSLMAVAALLLAADDVDGAILGTAAGSTVTVQELVAGDPASVSSDSTELDPDAPVFPVFATASLLTSDLEDRLTSIGLAEASIDDAAASTDANPREFGLELSAFSNSEDLAYSVSGSAAEVRALVFSDDPAVDPFPIEFRTDGTRTVESTLFLSGAVLLWRLDEEVEAEQMFADLQVTVEQEGLEEPLFETSLVITGDAFTRNPNGATTRSGRIDFDTGGIELLTEDVDEATRAALERLDEIAEVVVLVVPAQEHVYEYEVQRNVDFDVTARFTLRLRNEAAGTGVAAAWGQPFDQLADILDQALPDVDGKRIESALNKAMAAAAADQPTTSPWLCGAVGTVIWGFLGLAGLWLRMERRA